MIIRRIQNNDDLVAYDTWIKQHSEGNLWQSVERKQYLEALGKTVHIYVADDDGIKGSALVMVDTTSFGLSTWDIPRGPVGKYREELVNQIIADAKKDRCIAIYFSPIKEIRNSQFAIRNSSRLQHCEATRIIDLTKSEEEILEQMKQKGRYNIRVAEKHGVRVEESDDIDAYYQLATETGKRDQYTIVSKKKYELFLHDLPGAFLLLAYDNTEPIAGVLSVLWNGQAIYYYGASNYAQRAKMAPYLLQWEAMKRAKAAGCTSYDLLGISPTFAPSGTSVGRPVGSSNHPWDGISSFKEKFGGEIVTYPAEKMVVMKPVMKMMIDLKRKLFT